MTNILLYITLVFPYISTTNIWKQRLFEAGFQFAKNVDIQEIWGSGPLVIYGILSTLYDFCRVIFFHVCTQDNRFAHLLAKNVISIDNFFA